MSESSNVLLLDGITHREDVPRTLSIEDAGDIIRLAGTIFRLPGSHAFIMTRLIDLVSPRPDMVPLVAIMDVASDSPKRTLKAFFGISTSMRLDAWKEVFQRWLQEGGGAPLSLDQVFPTLGFVQGEHESDAHFLSRAFSLLKRSIVTLAFVHFSADTSFSLVGLPFNRAFQVVSLDDRAVASVVQAGGNLAPPTASSLVFTSVQSFSGSASAADESQSLPTELSSQDLLRLLLESNRQVNTLVSAINLRFPVGGVASFASPSPAVQRPVQDSRQLRSATRAKQGTSVSSTPVGRQARSASESSASSLDSFGSQEAPSETSLVSSWSQSRAFSSVESPDMVEFMRQARMLFRKFGGPRPPVLQKFPVWAMMLQNSGIAFTMPNRAVVLFKVSSSKRRPLSPITTVHAINPPAELIEPGYHNFPMTIALPRDPSELPVFFNEMARVFNNYLLEAKPSPSSAESEYRNSVLAHLLPFGARVQHFCDSYIQEKWKVTQFAVILMFTITMFNCAFLYDDAAALTIHADQFFLREVMPLLTSPPLVDHLTTAGLMLGLRCEQCLSIGTFTNACYHCLSRLLVPARSTPVQLSQYRSAEDRLAAQKQHGRFLSAARAHHKREQLSKADLDSFRQADPTWRSHVDPKDLPKVFPVAKSSGSAPAPFALDNKLRALAADQSALVFPSPRIV